MQENSGHKLATARVAPGTELSEGTVYVSITGLELKSNWFVPQFLYLSLRALWQARKTPGNLHASLREINGVKHTLTVWKDRSAMTSFAFSGAHKAAILAFPKIATGKTFGFETSSVPSWDEVHALWAERGVDYLPSAAR